ncbi:CBS domain-containing protein [Roseomonas sp. NAR14]|uniref:CBS domain-containing protein n=1 Tax=Roseomonas acroporae TaxID=2937791 RepID=A0A9X1YD29_9PROT|nr:CBS domain-containing protein [Roseomonas acroporae]MCK8784336.1 CBS domain-containing protein [Roseomonas acroporae]
MQVRDVMTKGALTVRPETPVRAVASLFAERGISGAPVVDADGTVIGVISEGDLLRQIAAPEEKPRSWLHRLIDSAPSQALSYAQAHGRTVRDVMSASPMTIGEEDSVAHAAKLLEEHRIRRLPVVRDGKLVGILSRADLMKALLSAPEPGATTSTDAEIERRLNAEMRRQSWTGAYYIFPSVQDGVVSFNGFCDSRDVERGLRVLAEGIPGVKEVRFDLAPVPPPMIA